MTQKQEMKEVAKKMEDSNVSPICDDLVEKRSLAPERIILLVVGVAFTLGKEQYSEHISAR